MVRDGGAHSPFLRVVTYNVHKCQGMDRRVKLDRVAAVLRGIKADVVALQEIFGYTGDGTGQARQLADELGMYCAFGENHQLNGWSYGNAVLSRYPLVSSRNYDLSVPGREPRGCLCVDIQLSDAVLHCFNVHLGTGFFERRAQARKLVTPELLRASTVKGPRIVLGDFNEWTRGLVSHVLSAEFRNADLRILLKQQRTYPGLLPFLHLDHIYYDEALLLESVGLCRSRLALLASDHLPLVAEFRVKHT